MNSNLATRPAVNNAALTKQTAIVVKDLLNKNRLAIMKAMPEGFNFERMMRSTINAVSTTPMLAKCDPSSIFLSTIRAFSMGIEPNGALNEGYLIPFYNSKKGVNDAQFMPSYRGLQNLARRSGEISDLYAKVVCENDSFEVEEGTERKIIHKPDYTKKRGNAVCYYAVFHTKDGGVDFEVMSIDEIERVRKASKSGNSGPWVEWFDEMAKKTVMKRLLKRAPMSIELAKAVASDDRAAMGDDAIDTTLDIEGLDISDAETPAEVQAAINADKTEALKEKLKSAKSAPVTADAGDGDALPM